VALGLESRGNDPGVPCDGGRVEQALHRQLHPESLSQLGDQLDGQQRVTAQLEEIVVDAHRLDAQMLLPQVGNRPLKFIAGSHVGGRQVRPRTSLH
jgi:hypothetical protein